MCRNELTKHHIATLSESLRYPAPSADPINLLRMGVEHNAGPCIDPVLGAITLPMHNTPTQRESSADAVVGLGFQMEVNDRRGHDFYLPQWLYYCYHIVYIYR